MILSVQNTQLYCIENVCTFHSKKTRYINSAKRSVKICSSCHHVCYNIHSAKKIKNKCVKSEKKKNLYLFYYYFEVSWTMNLGFRLFKSTYFIIIIVIFLVDLQIWLGIGLTTILKKINNIFHLSYNYNHLYMKL